MGPLAFGPRAPLGEAGPPCTRHYRAVVRTVHIGEWGRLVVYDDGEEPPPGLHGANDFWSGDEWRRPVVLRTGTGDSAYVAVWPTDGPPPSEGRLTERELEGVALAQPVSHHTCARCGAEVPGLYVETGLPFFQPRDRPHNWLRTCPACEADVDEARLHGMLPMPAR
jgi:hypothetical protein